MTVKDHYENHLASFYSWMSGDFETKEKEFENLIEEHKLRPSGSSVAIDLGAGHGIQSIALANTGYKVISIDFNAQLLHELNERSQGMNIETLNDDLRNVKNYAGKKPELIVCCGDTLTHLESLREVEDLIFDIAGALSSGGKVILTFRDYSLADTGAIVNIPVKSDHSRKLTCVLNYENDRVEVTDILEELKTDGWEKKQSSYYKIRINPQHVIELMVNFGFSILYDQSVNGMVTIIGVKK